MVPCSRVGQIYLQHKEKDGRGALNCWPPTLPQGEAHDPAAVSCLNDFVRPLSPISWIMPRMMISSGCSGRQRALGKPRLGSLVSGS